MLPVVFVFWLLFLIGVIVPDDDGIAELFGRLLPVMNVVLFPSNLALTPLSMNLTDFPNENFNLSPTVFCPTI